MITFKTLPSPTDYPFVREYSVLWNGKPIGTTAKSYGRWAAYAEGKYVGTFDKRKEAAERLRELDEGREVYPTTHVFCLTPPEQKEI